MVEDKNMANPTSDFSEVMTVLHTYFDGLHQGDVSKLRAIFHSDAWLKAPGVRRSLDTWLSDVGSRDVPALLHLPYEFKILDLDLVKDQAMAKIYCPLFEHKYIDYLGLLKEEGQWRIVTKMYTDMREKP